MVPRNARTATEKLFRVRYYLIASASHDRFLTFDEVMGRDAAVELLYKAQRAIGGW
jgi:hypothetical protein